jgi:hypothetical protein
MHRYLVALAALGLIFVACGGGGGKTGDDSRTYAPTVVPIKHIDFTGVDLTPADTINPPSSLLDQYPATVVTVNGELISGKSLVSEEISEEIGRRNRDPELATQAQTKPGAADSLEGVIDGELLRQAVERLGLLPSHAEAVTYTQEQEQVFLHPEQPTANFEEFVATLRQLGYPASNWAADERIVENYQKGLGMSRLRNQVCVKPAPTIKGFLNLFTSGGNCDEFLAKERKNAKIVYYVRWAD